MDKKNLDTDRFLVKNFIHIIWERKRTIIAITLITALCSGVFSVFFISPVYDTEFTMIVNMPTTLETIYGEYTLPIVAGQQYIEMIKNNNTILQNTVDELAKDNIIYTINELKKSIDVLTSLDEETTKNAFTIQVHSNDPNMAVVLAQKLYDNYKEYIYTFILENIFMHFSDLYQMKTRLITESLNTNKKNLEYYEELLGKIPQIINQKDVLTGIDESRGYDFFVLNNTVNENYLLLESDIIKVKQSIHSDTLMIDQYSVYLDELRELSDSVKIYKETNSKENLGLDDFGGIASNIILSSAPVLPEYKTSPSNAKNIIMGASVGMILSIGFLFFKDYFDLYDLSTTNRGK